MARSGPDTLEFYAEPIFNYSRYLESGQLCDCTIRVGDKEYAAHRAVLANGSGHFLHVFTSGMREDQNRTVEVKGKYCRDFPKLLEFLYTGAISVNEDEMVPLLDMSNYYDVPALEELLHGMMEKVTRDQLVKFVKECYEGGYRHALNMLVPWMQRFFGQISVAEFSNILDIVTFCDVLGGVPGVSADEKVAILNEFLGDAIPNDDERAALDRVAVGAVNVRPRWR